MRRARLSVVVLVVLVAVGGLALRSGSIRAASSSVWHRLVTRPQPATWQQSPPPSEVQLHVDTNHVLRPISRLIYGVAAGGPDDLTATGASLNRWGGNPNSRYNWRVGNAWNAARDWEFRNYGADTGTPSGPSVMADLFVTTNQSRGIASVITVPALGWVARNGNRDVASVQVPSDGGPPSGDGSNGAIVGYDPSANRRLTSVQSFPTRGAAASTPSALEDGAVFQDEWVAHLVKQFGLADAGGVGFYAIDNEPDLWSVTHTDVHPIQPDYNEELTTFLDYAGAIKSVDPAARILGPSLSGWTSLFYSARDRGSDNFKTHADRLAHGDAAFLPWWLEQVRLHDERAGQRTLDVLDVHWYPQSTGVFAGYTDEWTNRLRLRSTRSLWDPSYVDESWIGDTVQLIPRLRGWIDRYYPGTKLAIGEWNWGADKTMNGAIALADVLGIFGREGVDLAAYWTFPPAGSAGANAFTMYTNYDGQGNGFGDLALAATSSAPDDVQVFASRDQASGAVLIMLLNQRPDTALPTTVRLDGISAAGPASFYRLDATAPVVQYAGSQPAGAGDVQLLLPAESITVVRVEAS